MSETENETAAASASDDKLEFNLSKPIRAFKDEISVLKLRRPTGMDVVAVGNPVIYTPFCDPPRVEHDYPKVIAMAARLSGVPSSSLQKLEPQDLVELAWAISPFFMPK